MMLTYGKEHIARILMLLLICSCNASPLQYKDTRWRRMVTHICSFVGVTRKTQQWFLITLSPTRTTPNTMKPTTLRNMSCSVHVGENVAVGLIYFHQVCDVFHRWRRRRGMHAFTGASTAYKLATYMYGRCTRLYEMRCCDRRQQLSATSEKGIQIERCG